MQMWTRDGNATLDVRDPETDEMKPWAGGRRQSERGPRGASQSSTLKTTTKINDGGGEEKQGKLFVQRRGQTV